MEQCRENEAADCHGGVLRDRGGDQCQTVQNGI